MKIEFLAFDDCPNHEGARQLLDEVLAERGLTPEITEIDVADATISERVKFAGSPTIRINGVDVDPSYIDEGDYTLRCRVYTTRAGLRGVPERGWIEAAVVAASD